MGISPNIWGPSTWTFIHLIVLAEPEPLNTIRLDYYHNLFQLLTHLLPCEKCRNHLSENLQKLKPIKSLKTKRELFDWTVELHNLVNKIIDKKEWKQEEAYQHWLAISMGKKDLLNISCTSNYWKYITIVVIILFIMLIVARQLRKK
jgi:hypothetical protein